MRGRRCGKAAMIRWILLDHEIDDSASERKEARGVKGREEIVEMDVAGGGGGQGDNRKVLMKRNAPQDKIRSLIKEESGLS